MEFLGPLLDRLSFVVGRDGENHEIPDERPAFLSTMPAGTGSRRLAVAIVILSVLGFFAMAPFAKIQIGPVWPFIPAYQSALIICDLVTAVLLFGQFATLRSRALLLLAGGYLFTGCIAITHGLSFPGLLSPTGLLGAGPQSTAWLYMFWHAGFPLCVSAYSLLKGRIDAPPTPPEQTTRLVLMTIAIAVTAVVTLTLLPPPDTMRCRPSWTATATRR